MRFPDRAGRLFGGLIILFTMILGLATIPAEAQAGDATIEIHNRICPTGYDGEDFFEDCHGNPPQPGLTFTLTDGVTQEGTTNEQGNVGFANLQEGTYTIIGGVPAEFADYFVYCSLGPSETNIEQPVEFEYVTGGIQLFIPADTNILCDWYNIPYDLQGDPTPTPVPPTPTSEPGGQPFDLPIYKLLCDDDPGQQAVSEFLTTGPVPEGCEQAAGVTVTITGADGAEIGTCVTQAEAPCYVTVTVGTTVYGTEDPSTVPEGYVPLNDDTIEVEIPPASEAALVFVNVQAQSTPTAVPPTTTPVPTGDPLPPGRPLQIRSGSCQPGDLGDLVYELEDLRGPLDEDDDPLDADDETSGQVEDVIVAEVSSSSVPATLEELRNSEYIIVAFADEGIGTQQEVVACTEIGGVLNSAGNLVIGVQEQDDSGYTGIAYFAPAEEDASQTDVSIFLARDLADDDDDAIATPGA